MVESIEVKKHSKFSIWLTILGWVGMIIFAFHACTHMVAAGDTWVALACGRHFVNHGVDTVEPFSANSHKAGPTEKDIEKWPKLGKWIADKAGIETVRYWHPTGWVNQNWLTHVIFYWLTNKSPFADAQTFSFNSLVYWKFAIYTITVICVYYTSRLLGVHPTLSAVFACFAMFVGRSFLDIRPAGFSNLMVGVLLLLLALATHRNILYIWLIVPVAVFWCNVHGGYIYMFIILAPFAALNLLASISKKRFVSIGLKGVYHTVAAGFVAFLAVILFNPFHLTNLTHTFVISISKHAEKWRTVNEWHPAFEWSNPVGDEIPFLVMYIIAWLVLVSWAVVLIFTARFISKNSPKRNIKTHILGDYQLPKIDLALVAIGALTIYMAVRSRRFIPIAAIAACPILAMLVDQAIRAISATYNYRKKKTLSVGQMSANQQLFFTLVGAAAVLIFGTWWGLKFKHVYLDPWPTDTKFNSVFMRMTASNVKPFYACNFIRENQLKGKMFNYWTEGGFIAWGQEPDPNTGKTSLQLFMDGRAQAAYERKDYDIWAQIMFGGPEVEIARLRKVNPDYAKIGQWIGEELKKRNVWVVLMPSSQWDGPFVQGLERNPDWPVVFFDNDQKLFVDITTTQGKKVFEGILSGETIYPDEFSRDLIIGHLMLFLGNGLEAKKQGLDFVIKAFELNPSQVPMKEILLASQFSELKPKIEDVCKNYFDDFTKNKENYVKQDGYFHRIAAALTAGYYLEQTARKEQDGVVQTSYKTKIEEYRDEIGRLSEGKRW